MRCFILMFMIFLSHLAIASAQGVFQYGRIDFFKKIGTQEKISQAETKQSPETITDEWAEPIISPTGKVSIYVPPQEVRDFLEKPNPENARAYLEWNARRIEKLVLAQELLIKESKELGYMRQAKSLSESNSSSPKLGTSNDNTKPGVNYLFYFMLKGCSVCEKETQVIENVYLHHPEIRIEAFAIGFSDRELEEFRFSARQDNGMSKLFKITTYPAIAVFNKKNQRYFISGYVDKDRVLQLFE